MKNEIVNIVKMLKPDEVKDMKEYYFLKNEKVMRGVAVRCEKCGKLCSVNSVTIKSFGVAVKNITVAPITDDELGYNEEDDTNTCFSCG